LCDKALVELGVGEHTHTTIATNNRKKKERRKFNEFSILNPLRQEKHFPLPEQLLLPTNIISGGHNRNLILKGFASTTKAVTSHNFMPRNITE